MRAPVLIVLALATWALVEAPGIEDLLRELVHGDPAARAAAEAALLQRREEALPALRLALARVREEYLVHWALAQRLGLEPGEVEPSAPWYEQAYWRARDLLASGNARGARQLLDAVLVVEPQVPNRQEFIELRARTRDAQLKQEVVQGELLPSEAVAAFEAVPLLTLRLTNRGDAPVRIIAAKDGTLGEVQLAEEWLDPAGRLAKRHTRNILLPAGGDFELGPGGHRDLAITLPAYASQGAAAMRLELRVRLRPLAIQRAGERFSGFIDVDPRALVFLPQALGPSGAAGSEALLEAAGGADPGRAVALALILPAQERSAIIRTLIEGLADDAPPARFAALRALSGQALHDDATAWKSWWLFAGQASH